MNLEDDRQMSNGNMKGLEGDEPKWAWADVRMNSAQIDLCNNTPNKNKNKLKKLKKNVRKQRYKII